MSTMVVEYFLKGGDQHMDTKQIIGWVVALAAVNWGLVGLLNINLVETLLGSGTLLTKLVYILIGLVGAYKVYLIAGGKYKGK